MLRRPTPRLATPVSRPTDAKRGCDILRTGVIGLAALLAPAGRGRATDYYVSAEGLDANAGTSQAHPWRSIARVNATALAAGDRVLFRGGDVFDGNLAFDAGDKAEPGRPISVGSYGGRRATIRAGDRTAVLVKDVGGFVVQDLVVIGSGRETNRGSGVKVVNTLLGAVQLRSIRVEDVDASGFGREGIFVGGAAADRSQSGYQDVLILRCAAHDNAYFGIWVTGAGDPKATAYANHDVVIADCTAFENPGDPSYMESHSGNGILLEDVDTGRIERCVAFGNGALCNNKGGGPVGIWAHSARRVTIQHCASFRNRTGRSVDGGGFDFDGGVSESLMQYNYSSINDGAGYLLYAYPGSPHEFRGNVVRYNISEDDGLKNQYGGFYVVNDGSGVRDLEIYNNTVLVSPSREGRPRAVVVRKTEGVHFRNNLFQTTGGVPLLEVGADQPGLLFQGNAYWSGGAFFAIDDGGKTYSSLAAWRAATGRERAGAQETGIEADPRPTYPGAGEIVINAARLADLTAYRLHADSPMIDAGLDLRHLFGLDTGARDFWGNPMPRGRAPDIGAHEAR